jgi:hypothetical protein
MVSDLSKKLWFAYVVALLVWGLLAYVELGKYQVKGTLFAHTLNDRPYINDFVNMYSAARLASRCVAGEKVDVYDIKVQESSVGELIKPVVAELPFYFQYPPYAFALALPLSGLPMLYAWLAWDVVGVGLSSAALWAVAKQAFDTPFKRAFAMIAFLASFPAWISVWLGQPALFAGAGLTGFFLAVNARRPYLAALCTVPILVKMQYLPAIGLIGAITLGIPYALTVAVILIALVLLAVAVLGTANVIAFPQALSQETASAVSGVAAEVMQNLRGELTLLIPQFPDAIRILSLGVYLVATIWLAYMWFSMQRRGLLSSREGFWFAASVTTLIMLMTSVHTHRQDYLLMAAPCIWLYSLAAEWGDGKAAFWVRILVVSFPLASWLFYILHALLMLVHIPVQLFFLWALCLYAATLVSLRSRVDASRESKESPPQPEAS